MKYLTEDPRWITFYPSFNHSFFVNKAGYFDERPEIHTSVTQLLTLFALPFLIIYSWIFLLLIPLIFFGWGKLYIHLPIKTGIQDCDSAAWGFNYHDDTVWLYIGGGGNFEGGKKWKTLAMPWQLTWVRTSTLLKNGTDWYNETIGNRRSYEEDIEGNVVGSYGWMKLNSLKEVYPYFDKANDVTISATVTVEEREWRPIGMKWSKIFSKVRKSIQIEFDTEVGKGKGSWKGGVLGCSYELKPNESPKDCLKRMETERNF